MIHKWTKPTLQIRNGMPNNFVIKCPTHWRDITRSVVSVLVQTDNANRYSGKSQDFINKMI